jgi:hypothetical protein
MDIGSLPRIMVIAGLLLTAFWIVALIALPLGHAFGA